MSFEVGGVRSGFSQVRTPDPRLEPKAFQEYLELRVEEAKAMGEAALINTTYSDESEVEPETRTMTRIGSMAILANC